MANASLAGVVIAFDIDNTLMDPTGAAYRATVAHALARIELGLPAEKAVRAFEEVRGCGHALARLGLANPIHERGHAHAFAALVLTRGPNPALFRDLGISLPDQDRWWTLLSDLAALHAAARSSGRGLAARLEVEIRLRQHIAESESQALRAAILEVAARPRVQQWADGYRAAEQVQWIGRPRPLIEALIARGATPVVITEGRADIQREKLERLDVADLFAGRVLITEAAAGIPGAAALAAAVDRKIQSLLCDPDGVEMARQQPVSLFGDEELSLLWHYFCLLGSWSTKSPWFYGRCLHAIRNDPVAPEAALADVAFVAPPVWRQWPLRFVIVGDRFDKDIEPLVALLGPDAAATIQLCGGKYSGPCSTRAALRQAAAWRTFDRWDALAEFLTTDLRDEDVPRIASPPAVLDRTRFEHTLIDRGQASELPAVHALAALLARSVN